MTNLSELSKKIARIDDIRGLSGAEINEHLAYRIGCNISNLIQSKERDTIIVCRDPRESSAFLEDALLEAILANGTNVIMLGIAPTPAAYFALREFDLVDAIVVTASHNGLEYAGFKIVIDGETPGISDLRNLITNEPTTKFGNRRGCLRRENITIRYCDWIQENTDLVSCEMPIIWDSIHGASAEVVDELSLRLGRQQISLCSGFNSTFKGRAPDPSNKMNCARLGDSIRSSKATFGISFDGDGDRFCVMDQYARLIPADVIMSLFLNEIDECAGESVVIDIKASSIIDRTAVKKGVNVIRVPTGQRYIRAAVKKNNSILGGEISGHYSFGRTPYVFDDGLYAASYFLRCVSIEPDKAEQFFDNYFSSYHVSPEYRWPIGDFSTKIIMDAIRERVSKLTSEIDYCDGIRFTLEDGWALLRPSQTENILSVRFEGITKASHQIMKSTVKSIVSDFLVI